MADSLHKVALKRRAAAGGLLVARTPPEMKVGVDTPPTRMRLFADEPERSKTEGIFTSEQGFPNKILELQQQQPPIVFNIGNSYGAEQQQQQQGVDASSSSLVMMKNTKLEDEGFFLRRKTEIVIPSSENLFSTSAAAFGFPASTAAPVVNPSYATPPTTTEPGQHFMMMSTMKDSSNNNSTSNPWLRTRDVDDLIPPSPCKRAAIGRFRHAASSLASPHDEDDDDDHHQPSLMRTRAIMGQQDGEDEEHERNSNNKRNGVRLSGLFGSPLFDNAAAAFAQQPLGEAIVAVRGGGLFSSPLDEINSNNSKFPFGMIKKNRDDSPLELDDSVISVVTEDDVDSPAAYSPSTSHPLADFGNMMIRSNSNASTSNPGATFIGSSSATPARYVPPPSARKKTPAVSRIGGGGFFCPKTPIENSGFGNSSFSSVGGTSMNAGTIVNTVDRSGATISTMRDERVFSPVPFNNPGDSTIRSDFSNSSNGSATEECDGSKSIRHIRKMRSRISPAELMSKTPFSSSSSSSFLDRSVEEEEKQQQAEEEEALNSSMMSDTAPAAAGGVDDDENPPPLSFSIKKKQPPPVEHEYSLTSGSSSNNNMEQRFARCTTLQLETDDFVHEDHDGAEEDDIVVCTPVDAGIQRVDSGSFINSPNFMMLRSRSIPDSPERTLRRADSLSDTKLLAEQVLRRTNSTFLYGQHFYALGSLGKGSFSEVQLVQHHLTGQLYAVKMSKKMFRGRKDRRQYLREVEAVAKLPDHPNIVKYYRAWQCEQHFFIQMEYCDGGSLRKIIQAGPSSLVNTCQIMHDVFSGLAIIHAHRIIHLDIKPDNILFSSFDNSFKIADFGLAVPEDEWDDQEGDKIYMAAEVLMEGASSASDIFSTGLVFWELLSGIRPPTDGEAWMRVRQEGDLPFPSHLQVDSRAQEMIRSMLAHNPLHRPSARQCADSELLLSAINLPRESATTPTSQQ